MPEKEPSAASLDLTQSRQSADVTPGGPFPAGRHPLDMVLNPSGPSHQYTLQFLIAAIKKLSK